MANGTPGQRVALLLCLIAAVAVWPSVRGVTMDRCMKGEMTLVDQVNALSLDCFTSEDPASTVRWTLLTADGSTVEMGTCDVLGEPCTKLAAITTVTRAVGVSHLDMSPIAEAAVAGLITCTETREVEVSSESCRVHVVHLRLFKRRQEVADLAEGAGGRVACFKTPMSPSTLTFTMDADTSAPVHLGSCDQSNTCLTLLGPERTVVFRSTSKIDVMFSPAQRDHGGLLTCTYLFGVDQREEDSAVLNIYSPPVLQECTVDTHRHNWSAVVVCEVTRIYSTAGIYDIHVHEMYLSEPQHDNNPANIIDDWDVEAFHSDDHTESLHYVRHAKASIAEALTSFVDPGDGKEYFTGQVVYSWNLSPNPGADWLIRTRICAGQTDSTCTDHRQAMPSVYPPSTPTHNCTDLSHVSEGGPGCLCVAKDLGVPAGRLAWLAGNTTLTLGDYGEGHLLLPMESLIAGRVSRDVVCQLDWIEPLYADPPIHYRANISDDDDVKWAVVGGAVVLGVVLLIVVVVLVVKFLIWPRVCGASRVGPL